MQIIQFVVVVVVVVVVIVKVIVIVRCYCSRSRSRARINVLQRYSVCLLAGGGRESGALVDGIPSEFRRPVPRPRRPVVVLVN